MAVVSELTRIRAQAVALTDHVTLDTPFLLHRHYKTVGLDGPGLSISELDPRESP